VLPHALIHIVESYLRAGHLAGACAFLAEVSHKKFIKLAARLGRTFGSHTRSEVAMLKWILTDEIYVQAARVAKETSETIVNNDSAADIGDGYIHRTYSSPLLPDIMVTSSTDFIQKEGRSLLRNSWEKKMISKKIRVTRRELLSMLCAKLRVADTRANRTDLVRRQHFVLSSHLCFEVHICILKLTFVFKIRICFLKFHICVLKITFVF
jgi:hypothetical protein